MIKRAVLIGLCLILGFAAEDGRTMAARMERQSSLRSVTIHVDTDLRSRFFEELKKFADAHAFAIRIAPTTPDGQRFQVQMWREDIRVIGTNSVNAGAFRISFFQNGNYPVVPGSVNRLVDSLKTSVTAIHGIRAED